MNWTEILKNAGIPESPGRIEAIKAALISIDQYYEKHGKKRAKGTNTRKVTKVARMDYKAAKL